MVRKKIDSRLRIQIENGVQTQHRSFFVIVGDKGRDQVPILHHMLTKATVKSRPNVLWCYKKDLGFSNHRKSKMKKLQKKIQHGQFDVNDDDPFELFVAATSIRYCYYKDTHKILGNTFGMCVLQDFEALTPNLLARTIETVEGGGLVVLLLQSVQSLKQLFAMSMDVHKRYRTEAHTDVVGRFNERFILSLASNPKCIVIDDQLHILPISSHVKNITELPPKSENESVTENEVKLKDIKTKLEGSQPTEALVKLCKTLDQAQALLQFIDAITDKKLDSTVSLTASRGRGKSAALGLAIAAAVGFGYSNIFVTSPSPENLQTLFDFVFKGFDAMEYEEHTDYDIVQSTNPEFNNAVVRINIQERNNHRQTIQYLHPTDAHKLGQAELVVIDEAAAIPLPLVKALLGPYLVFMSSTINGYEGTGRSLSLKLLDQLRKQSDAANSAKTSVTSRLLKEVTLDESIRYKPGDATETWLNKLLCLDANNVNPICSGVPSPEECDLYYINRDTLFSYHKASETFLQRLMSLFVSSHYKNTPNDLQMMSDAPAHHLFCLLGPTKGNSLPEVLCAIQVCLEGEISKGSIRSGLAKGQRASGDLIPWTMAQQYPNETDFPSLSGARIVRIATHPNYQKMGYGSAAIKLLQKYYEMQMANLDETETDTTEKNEEKISTLDDEEVSLLEETLKPKDNLPPLLLRLSERRPEKLDYLGVSFGLTQELLRFWKRLGFIPTYLRQTSNELTGEHSTIMLKLLTLEENTQANWLKEFWADFRCRIVRLLGFEKFTKFSAKLAFMVICNKIKGEASNKDFLFNAVELSKMISPHDLQRLERYCNNLSDYHLILDIVPELARLYFLDQVDNKMVELSVHQKLILVGLGLQCKSVEVLEKELELPVSQILALFQKMMKKFCGALNKIQEDHLASNYTQSNGGSAKKGKKNNNSKTQLIEASLEEELEAAAEDVKRKQKESLERLKLEDFSQYKIKGTEDEWSKALVKGSKNLISVKSGEKRIVVDENSDATPSKKKKKSKKTK